MAHVEKDRTGVLAGQTLEWPTFDNVAKPLLGLLGATQASMPSDEEVGMRDAEALAREESERAGPAFAGVVPTVPGPRRGADQAGCAGGLHGGCRLQRGRRVVRGGRAYRGTLFRRARRLVFSLARRRPSHQRP